MRRRPWIDWIHTAHVQGNLVRDFVKWDDQPTSLTGAAESLLRAYRVTTTEPTAPVYVCFDGDLQEMRVDDHLAIPNAALFGTPSRLAPDPATLERAADLLVGSLRPAIVADFTGRRPESVAALVTLAEALGAPVIDRGGRFNFPNAHPLDASGAAAEALAEADVVLLLDVQDPFGALATPERIAHGEGFVQPAGCKIISMSVNDLLVRSWTGDYQRSVPTDLAISADTSIALPLLVDLIRERLVHNAVARDGFSTRGASWADRNRARRTGWRQQAAASADRSPLSLAAVAATVWDLIRDQDWCLANGTLNGWARRLWSWREPHQYLGTSGGAGLGYGMGASIGASLAARGTNRLTVNLQADGDFLFTPSALWTAAHHHVPMLAVLHNNRSLYNSEEHAMNVARYRERPPDNAGVGTRITDPNVNFAKLTESFELHGEGPVTQPEELRPALERALRVIKDCGEMALVDVVCEAR